MVQKVSDEEESSPVDLRIRNIGGISNCNVSFTPGVSVLEGRNATNRTSLLNALAEVLGSSSATLKTDEESGHIELELEGNTYESVFNYDGDKLETNSEKYTKEEELVDLFVRLLNNNPVRQAVKRGGDLRDVLMRPVDVDQIQRKIRERKRERNQIEDRLQEITENREALPGLERRQRELDSEIDEIEKDIDDIKAKIDNYEATKEEVQQAEELFEDLQEKRHEIQDIDAQINNQEEKLGELSEEREEIESKLQDCEIPRSELESVRSKLKDLRHRKRETENTIDDLQSIVNFNEGLVSGEGPELPVGDGSQDVTSQLDPDSQVVNCWTCGNRVERREIGDRLDELQAVVNDYREQRNRIEGEITELESRQSELEQQVTRKENFEETLTEIDDEIKIRETKKTKLSNQREDLLAEIEMMEQQVDETEELRDTDLATNYQQLSELQYRRGQVEKELEDVQDQIEEIEELENEEVQLESQHDELNDEIEQLRSRVQNLESEVVEKFNEHMETLLEILEYENISRVWIERKYSSDTSSGASIFDLHIVRESDDGSVYEDSIDTLSESEREIIGLTVALAGYMTHDVHEEIPFILLDSLEAIDADRIAGLVDYFSEFASFLIVALLPEDAARMPEEYTVINMAPPA